MQQAIRDGCTECVTEPGCRGRLRIPRSLNPAASLQAARIAKPLRFYELGPGSQLKGILKRIDGKIADKMCNLSV